MAWHFFDFGLLMPALVPAAHKNDADVLEWTNGGEYELQVRGRLREHLEYFMNTYMPEGSFNPTIQATPDKDYNFRFYTTVASYAEGVKNATLAMDYEKFKVTSERFAWNTKYHTILNSIWARLCDLNQPGGFYGPKSADNPRGYSGKYYGENSDWYTKRHNQTLTQRYVGSSFGVADEDFKSEYYDDYEYHEGPAVVFDPEVLDDRRDPEFESWGQGDWQFERETKTEKLIEELDSIDVPMSMWWKYCSPREYSYLEPVLKANFNKKILRSMRKKNQQLFINSEKSKTPVLAK